MCAVACANVCERVARVKSSNRSRSTTVRPTRAAARIRRVTRSTRPTRTASSVSGERRVARPPEGVLRTDRSAAPAGPHRARDRDCARARAGAGPSPGPSIETSTASASRATSPTVEIPRSWSLRAVDRTDAPEPLDRKRMEELELAIGRHDEQSVGLGDPARHLREELGARDADGDREADPFEHVAAQSRRDLDRRARHLRQTADFEEGFVDRQSLDQRRRVPEHLEHRLARLGVRRHAGRDDDRPRAQPARLPRRPSRCGPRTPWPRSSPRARRHRRR